ncbi:MAG: class I SAM-dependent methyltransferase [Vicinamibacteraceae bacterium]
MKVTERVEGQQAALWNGAAGHAWVDEQALLDRLFAPFQQRLVDAVVAEAPGAVLDVGCGTGSTTLAIARALGAAQVTGIDISVPMIAAATARAADAGVAASFIRADAQDHPFEAASVDMIVSRFGVMFFDDPVRAFANLARTARPGAALRCIAWRSAAENPFMTAAERVAAPLLPDLPPRRPDVPGQFAFANGDRVRGILAESGWKNVDVAPLDVDCRLSEPDLLAYVSRLGPVGVALREADEATRARVVATVRAALDSYMVEGECRFTAACWTIDARA